MLLNKYYVIVLQHKNYVVVLKKRHARGPRIQGDGEHVKIHARGPRIQGGGEHVKIHARGPRIQGGGEHVKIAYQFHAASTRRDKNTRLAWKRSQTYALTLLTFKCPFVQWTNRNVHWTFKCPFVHWTRRNVHWTFKCPFVHWTSIGRMDTV